MKKLKHLLFSGLALMLVLSSCTMEKRIYSSGYHIEWKKSKQNPDRQKLVNKDNGKTTEQNKIATVEQSDNETNTIDNTTTIKDETITASAGDKQIILPQKEKISLKEKNKQRTILELIRKNVPMAINIKPDVRLFLKHDDKRKLEEGNIILMTILILLLIPIYAWIIYQSALFPLTVGIILMLFGLLAGGMSGWGGVVAFFGWGLFLVLAHFIFPLGAFTFFLWFSIGAFLIFLLLGVMIGEYEKKHKYGKKHKKWG